MPRIGGEDEPLFAYGPPVVGGHQPQHAFAMGHDSPVAQLRGHPAVPVAAILQHDLLNQIAQSNVGLARFVLFVVAVETSPAHAHDLAGAARLEALKLHHVSDLCVDAVAPVPVLLDRKSTRLNSSHLGISYAVSCLKKKNPTRRISLSSAVPSRARTTWLRNGPT